MAPLSVSASRAAYSTASVAAGGSVPTSAGHLPVQSHRASWYKPVIPVLRGQEDQESSLDT